MTPTPCRPSPGPCLTQHQPSADSDFSAPSRTLAARAGPDISVTYFPPPFAERHYQVSVDFRWSQIYLSLDLTPPPSDGDSTAHYVRGSDSIKREILGPTRIRTHVLQTGWVWCRKYLTRQRTIRRRQPRGDCAYQMNTHRQDRRLGRYMGSDPPCSHSWFGHRHSG
jgi:hypothetical protein